MKGIILFSIIFKEVLRKSKQNIHQVLPSCTILNFSCFYEEINCTTLALCFLSKFIYIQLQLLTTTPVASFLTLQGGYKKYRQISNIFLECTGRKTMVIKVEITIRNKHFTISIRTTSQNYKHFRSKHGTIYSCAERFS